MDTMKTCQNCNKDFEITGDDLLFYERMKVPPPTFCPECRMMRRFLFLNQRRLFRRKDDATGEMIYANMPASSPMRVYNLAYWNSDNWDASEYARDYDFSKPFFEQLRELLHAVPWPALSVTNMVNSDYCDQAGFLKNCYLCFESVESENMAYMVRTHDTKDSFDLYESEGNELCYESVGLEKCFRTFFSVDCESSSDVWFSQDLSGCSHCFGCVNLRNKSFYIFNKQYTREEYLEKIQALNLGSYESIQKIRERVMPLWKKFPVKFMHGSHNMDVKGEHIYYSKKIYNGYLLQNTEDAQYSQLSFGEVKGVYDITNSWMLEQAVDSVTVGEQAHGIRFSWECWNGAIDQDYSIHCRGSSHIFGSVGLKKKEYCILNKQYSKDEYSALREKIIRHMTEMPFVDTRGVAHAYGEFFPQDLSPYAYNETIAQDLFPIAKEQAEGQKYAWREPERVSVDITLRADDLPDHVTEASDDVLKEVMGCVSCAQAFRLIPMELAFYRRIGLPLPRLCPECRFLARAKFLNPPVLVHRKCTCAGTKDDSAVYANTTEHFHGTAHCPNEFETSYPPRPTSERVETGTSEKPNIVYCEQCYHSEVV